jgi:hypothetical protein
METTTPHVLQFFPGELLRLLRKEGLMVAPDSPLMGTAALGAGWSPRTSDAILDEAVGVVDRTQLQAHLRALVAPNGTVEIRRGMHRQPPAAFFACAGPGLEPVFSIVNVEPDGSCRILLLSSGEALVAWTVEALRYLPAPEIVLRRFPRLVPSGLVVVLAMADLFRSIYTHPDPTWRPEAAIHFSVRRLWQILDDGKAGRDGSSIAAAWSTLAGGTIAMPSHEQIAGVLILLANEGLLHLEVDDAGEAVFALGESITWAVRCLAWWDLTLVLSASGGDGGEAPDNLAAI